MRAEAESGAARWPRERGLLGCGVWPGGPRAASDSLMALAREFPHIPISVRREAPSGSLSISEVEWCDSSSDPSRWDAALSRLASPRWLCLQADGSRGEASDAISQILTRYQRLAPRTNERSRAPGFARALSLHRQLHDLDKPLVRADYDHAVDVWQWVLRLWPSASATLQLAALFHDIERLFSEPDRRVEQHAADYQVFKDAHARVGAEVAARSVRASGFDDAVAAGVQRLIEGHERAASSVKDEELSILGDADALSFFSLNSPGFADYFPASHTRMKVRYSLGRLSAGARQRLDGIKLRADIAAHLLQARRAEALSRTQETST